MRPTFGFQDPASPKASLTGLVTRIQKFSVPGGGYPYYEATSPSAEPTVLSALALFAHDAPKEIRKTPVERILGLQNKDGSLGIDPSNPDQGLWLTAQLGILLHHEGPKDRLKSALDYLLALKSVTIPNDPRIRQDNTLSGWPWIPGTFGWVEPTGWSLMALHLAGLAGHDRADEGRRFLLDRQIPSGGWNYGNPGLNAGELLPFWDTTGLALVALCGHVREAGVARSLDLIERHQDKIVSLCGLAWAVLGLQSYGRAAPGLTERLQEVMSSIPDAETNVAHFALGLIALSGKKIFVS